MSPAQTPRPRARDPAYRRVDSRPSLIEEHFRTLDSGLSFQGLVRLRVLLAGRDSPLRTPKRSLRRRQGSVLDAVTTVLQEAGRPLRVRDIHVAAETLLCGPIPFSSVNEALSTHAGGDQRFRRLRYGVYEQRS